jgi:hypothetical protein
MSSFLISELKDLSKKKLNFILDITNEEILNDVVKFILSKKDQSAVLFLIENNKISKALSLDLFDFIMNNKYWDMFLNLDYDKFDIHVNEDYALRLSSFDGHIEVVKFLIEKGANIHARDDYALRYSSLENYTKIVKFLLNSDLEYFSKDQRAIDIVKKHKLIEFYEKFEIQRTSRKIPQSKNDIMKYINTNDLESLKICNEFDFSMDGYYYFFKSLLFNNIEINQTIFGFIKDKEELRGEFNNIFPFFDNKTRNKFHKLFENEKIIELKSN